MVAQGANEPTPVAGVGERQRAEALYDDALQRAGRAEYTAAAEGFLAADALAPNPEALQSAIAAARRAQEHILVVWGAQRAIARESSDPKLAAKAREALAEAIPHLSRLELDCEGQACTITVDGALLAAHCSGSTSGRAQTWQGARPQD